MNQPAVEIEFEGVTKRYGERTVLEIPALAVKAGESLGLVGNNGAGKTTLFRLLLDLVAADGGVVRSRGLAVAGSGHWKHYTGSFLDDRFLIDFLRPEEYFAFVGSLHGLSEATVRASLEQFRELFRGEILGQGKLIRELSSGNRKKVGVAAALLADPAVALLDEPFPHLDPSSIRALERLLRQIRREQRTTLIISSHSLAGVVDLCDRIVILEQGRIARDLPTGPATLAELEAYFTDSRANEEPDA